MKFNLVPTKIFETARELADFVGNNWKALQNSAPPHSPFIVSSPLSSTPRPLYQWIVANAKSIQNWGQFRFLMMDEQFERDSRAKYVDRIAPTSFITFVHTHLIDPVSELVDMDLDSAVVLPELNRLAETDEYIRDHGGIDLLVLAVGLDGHYAQVMPGTTLETGFHIARLTGDAASGHTNSPNSPFFGHQFSEYGMSLGPRQVLEAKSIFVIVSGEHKRAVAERLFSLRGFDSQFPISIILHEVVRRKVALCVTMDVLGRYQVVDE